MTEILDKGYNVVGFSTLLNKKKPNQGDDLSNFTIEELKRYAEEYTSDLPVPEKPKSPKIPTIPDYSESKPIAPPPPQ